MRVGDFSIPAKKLAIYLRMQRRLREMWRREYFRQWPALDPTRKMVEEAVHPFIQTAATGNGGTWVFIDPLDAVEVTLDLLRRQKMNFKARKPRASRNRCHMCKPHKELGKNRKDRRRISERKRLAKTEEEK